MTGADDWWLLAAAEPSIMIVPNRYLWGGAADVSLSTQITVSAAGPGLDLASRFPPIRSFSGCTVYGETTCISARGM